MLLWLVAQLSNSVVVLLVVVVVFSLMMVSEDDDGHCRGDGDTQN